MLVIKAKGAVHLSMQQSFIKLPLDVPSKTNPFMNPSTNFFAMMIHFLSLNSFRIGSDGTVVSLERCFFFQI